MAFGYLPPKSTGSKINFFKQIRELRQRTEGFNNLLKRIQVGDVKKALDLKNNDRVLEIGAGAGCGYACELSKQVKMYVATDIFDNSFLYKYKQTPPALKIVTCDVHELPFNDKTFDKVFMSEVIPVLKDPAKAMRQAGRVLKDNGTIIMVNGGQYKHIADFYDSSNVLIKLIKNYGIKKRHIPINYDEYHKQLVRLHGTNSDYFIDREKYLERLFHESDFSIERKNYSVRYCANYFYQLVCFIKICFTGNQALSRKYIYLLPLLRFLNNLSKSGKGMALIIVAKKRAD